MGSVQFGQVLMSDLRRVIGDRLIPCTMGANASQLEKDIGSDLFPANEHYFGLVNFGNTCYSNSVLQALYFCRPFREKVLEYKAKNKRTKETLLTCLADLFYSIVTQKRKVRSTDDMIIFSVVFLNMNFNRWGRLPQKKFIA